MRKILILLSAAFLLLSCGGNADVKTASCVEDLNGTTVAVITGSLNDLVLSKSYPEIKLFRIATMSEGLAAVENGKADFIMADEVMFIGCRAEERGLCFSFTSDIVAGNIAIAVQKQNTVVCNEFNDFILEIRQNGIYDEMQERWCGENCEQALLPEEALLPDTGKPLRVAIMPSFPFTFMHNGRWEGFEMEMMNRFAIAKGYAIQYMLYDFSATIAALTSNKVDIICSFMTVTDERAKQVLFSSPYYYTETAVYGRSTDGPAAAVAKKSFIESVKYAVDLNLIQEDRWKLLIDGFWETIVISFFSIIFGTMVGGVICWMRMSRRRLLRMTAQTIVDVIRGVPILVFLMIMFYVVFSSSSITARWVAVIAFSINFGAYVSEMFRTGIMGVDKGQTEAGLAMGFGSVRTFIIFILPQAIKNILPVFKGEAVSLIKNTSIVGYVAIQDLTKVSDIIRSRTFDAFFPLILISIIYFILAWLFGKLLDNLGKKLK